MSCGYRNRFGAFPGYRNRFLFFSVTPFCSPLRFACKPLIPAPLFMRAFNHDYRSKCIYHLTLTKTACAPAFSAVVAADTGARTELTPVGVAISRALRVVPSLHPALRLLQYVVMPDHLHLLLQVTEPTPRVLGRYVGMLKVRITQRVAADCGLSGPVLADGFHDRILKPWHNLQHIFNYIRDNPRRLLVRRLHPEYFRRVNVLTLGDTQWMAYGNVDLLANPFKEAVAVHRADTTAVKQADRARWLHTAVNGGVLVSPFISPDECDIRREAEALGGRLIVLGYSPFGERFKPAAHDFCLCESGRLLLLAPLTPMAPTRSTFLWLNKWAADIATVISQAK